MLLYVWLLYDIPYKLPPSRWAQPATAKAGALLRRDSLPLRPTAREGLLSARRAAVIRTPCNRNLSTMAAAGAAGTVHCKNGSEDTIGFSLGVFPSKLFPPFSPPDRRKLLRDEAKLEGK